MIQIKKSKLKHKVKTMEIELLFFMIFVNDSKQKKNHFALCSSKCNPYIVQPCLLRYLSYQNFQIFLIDLWSFSRYFGLLRLF